ncbi:fibronectin type III domain-containing protein [Actinoplanes sp. NPDC049599]|uniref:fibronectin type III domain-containing protein n=1 Tax=Actinoplanes sp. NPDC049599 TaxID=3363903 RepID=UPI00378F3FDA
MRRWLALLLVFAALTPGSPARADSNAPATPQRLSLGAGTTSMSLSWEQPRTGPRAQGFQVYEDGQVVARATTTSATVAVAFNSTHTYTVTAVDGQGHESAPTAPVSGHAWASGVNPECLSPAPLTITATAITASAASLSWPRHPLWQDLELRVGGVSLGRTTRTSARVGGLAPETTYSAGLYRYNNCLGQTVPVALGSLTTAAGSAARPAAPSALTVAGRTDTTVRLSWTAAEGPAPSRYAVYDGDTLVARTSSTTVTVGRLYHASWHTFTVAALNAAGDESTHTAPLPASTEACQAVPPRPIGLTATAVSPSSVRLRWVFPSAATSYTVLDGDRPVVTAAGPEAMVTGLASGSRHTFRVTATLPNGCGETPRGTAVTVTTLAGPAGRAAQPADLTLTGNAPLGVDATAITLAWTASSGEEPATGYRVYEGATLAGETTGTELSLTVGAGTRHTYTVVAVAAAGTESAQSAPLTVYATYLPPP